MGECLRNQATLVMHPAPYTCAPMAIVPRRSMVENRQSPYLLMALAPIRLRRISTYGHQPSAVQ